MISFINVNSQVADSNMLLMRATMTAGCRRYTVAGSDMNTHLTIIDSLWEGK